MGLDQYAYVKSEDENAEPAFVWRKHAKLQTFMEILWADATGRSATDLNCNELVLSVDDIDRLDALLKDENLPHSEGGFFFGHQFQDESAAEYAEYDAEFCAWARDQIAAGETVIYSCWW